MFNNRLWWEKHSPLIAGFIFSVIYLFTNDKSIINVLLIQVSLLSTLIMFVTIAIFSFVIVRYKHHITGVFPIFAKAKNKENPHFRLLIEYTTMTLGLLITSLIMCSLVAMFPYGIIHITWILFFSMTIMSWAKLTAIHIKLVKLLIIRKMGLEDE